MPRHPDPFDLDEDDFLKELPTFDSWAFGEIDPPAWALRAIAKRGGKKHPKREIQQTPMFPAVSFIPAKASPINGRSQLPAHYSRDSDAEAIFQKAIAKSRRKGQLDKSKQQVSARKLVPPGNLIEDDYRYWKGFALGNAYPNEGTCRWCQNLFKSRPAMLAHHNGGHCKEHLAALYRYAKLSSRTQRYCFSCKRETSHDRWGIPMCDNEHCIAIWKFNFNVQLPGFMQYKRWALSAQATSGPKGPFGDLPPTEDSEDDVTWGTPC